MDFFDLIRELRKGKPDPKKAEKAMKILGWICVVGGFWNFIIFFVGPFKESPFNLPPQYPYLALIILLELGTLFFRAARGIKEMAPWGKKTGQIAIVLLICVFFGFMFAVFPIKTIPLHNSAISLFFILFGAVVIAQFAIPAYFGVRYLARLPVKEIGYSPDRYRQQERAMTMGERINRDRLGPQMTYKEALFPFGVFGTFAIFLAVPLLLMFIGQKYVSPELMAIFFAAFFLFIFLGPVSYNYLHSSFQDRREVIASFTGGGSIFLFHGSWPFFRLIVYKDGLELRFMFHRFFIPYDKMEDIPDKGGFFNRGILIKSDLPDVPSGIRFGGFGMKKIVQVVNEARNNYLSRIKGEPSESG
jgi:hypothetical protein